jgi:hypothetical protein
MGQPLPCELRTRLAQLGRLGPSITKEDAARILGIDEARLAKYIDTAEGKDLWRKARAEGRVELIANIRKQAMDGSAPAQRLLAQLLAQDDARSLGDIRIEAKEVRVLLDRSGTTIARRVHKGEMIPAGPDKRYRLGAIFELIPRLWGIIETLRDKLSRLEAIADPVKRIELEARQAILHETARKKRFENDLNEDRFVSAGLVRNRFLHASRVIREQAENLTDEIKLKPSLDGRSAAVIDEARRSYLRRCENIANDGA